MSSPIQRKLNRLKRNRDAGHALARALAEASAMWTRQPDAGRLGTLARRKRNCAVSASFKVVTPERGASYIEVRNRRSCKFVLCMQCARLRAREQVRKYRTHLDVIREQNPDAIYLLCTLTTRNEPIARIKAMLDLHETGLQRLHRSPKLKRALLGHLTSLETTIGGTPENPEAHVHSHGFWVMRPLYFSREHNLYLPQAEIVRLWRQACRLTYDPICDIRRVRGPDGDTGPSAVREACVEVLKYAIAPQTLFQRDEFGMHADPTVVGHVALALYKRRLVRFAGCFAVAAKTIRQRNKETAHG